MYLLTSKHFPEFQTANQTIRELQEAMPTARRDSRASQMQGNNPLRLRRPAPWSGKSFAEVHEPEDSRSRRGGSAFPGFRGRGQVRVAGQ